MSKRCELELEETFTLDVSGDVENGTVSNVKVKLIVFGDQPGKFLPKTQYIDITDKLSFSDLTRFAGELASEAE